MKYDGIMKMLEGKCKVGMVLTLGDKVRTCIEIKEDSYGMRYDFDDGIGWTKSNIASNIMFTESRGLAWKIK